MAQTIVILRGIACSPISAESRSTLRNLRASIIRTFFKCLSFLKDVRSEHWNLCL